MRRFFIFMTFVSFLLGFSHRIALGDEASESIYKLPALVVPEVPLDDNPFRREVFSLKDVREGDPELLKRIVATRMDFPLMFDPCGKFASELFPNPDRARFGKNFTIVISINSIIWPAESARVLRAIKKELAAQGLDQGRTDRELRLEQMVFLKNYGTLCEYAKDFSDAGEEARREVIETFEQVYDVCERVLEFKALTLNGIGTLDQIDTHYGARSEAGSKLRFERFVTESKDMNPEDYSSILEIRNPGQFRELCLERTSEMLADENEQNVGELLANMEPSDAVVMASYFARNRVPDLPQAEGTDEPAP